MRYSIALFVLFGIVGACGSDNPSSSATSNIEVGTLVQTSNGPVSGVANNGLVIFKGMPYAAPPTVERRFAPPLLPTPWTAPRDASAFGAACPQRGIAPSTAEDCLSINVWTQPSGPARPVMVYIHGGGYVEGSSRAPTYDGADLTTRTNVVVVSFNYRLGTLGFLALPQLEAADGGVGNWGVRDQIAALQWVQANATKFGGDPERVMIFGESAGGSSVCNMLASPLSQGLFAGAAIQSGGCQLVTDRSQPVGQMQSAYEIGLSAAVYLGCTDANTIATCLRGQPVSRLLDFLDNAQNPATPVTAILGFPLTSMLPVRDGVVLDMTPVAALSAGRSDVPLIVGSNLDDASAFVQPLVTETDGAFSAYLTLFGRDAQKTQLLAIYPPAVLGEQAAASRFATDISFGCIAQEIATASASGVPSYLYELERGLPGPLASLGAFHGADFLHLFRSFAAFGITPGADDLALSLQMQTGWADFATNLVPTWTPTWPAATTSTPSYLRINTAAGIGNSWREGRCDQLRAIGVL